MAALAQPMFVGKDSNRLVVIVLSGSAKGGFVEFNRGQYQFDDVLV